MTAIGLGGCSDGAGAPAASDGSSGSGSGMTLAQARSALADYDRRADAALRRAAGPPYDVRAWAAADSGPQLEADAFLTAQARGERQRAPEARRHQPVRVVGHSRDAAGETALVLGPSGQPHGRPTPARSWSAGESTPAPPTTAPLHVLHRGTGQRAWTMWGSLGAPEGDLPPAQEGGAPSAAQRRAVARLAEPVALAVGGQQTSQVTVTRQARAALAATDPDPRDVDSLTRSCAPYTARGAERPDAAPTVRSGEGAVSVLPLRCRVTTIARPGMAFRLQPWYRQATGQREAAPDTTVRSTVVLALVSRPDEGPARVLGLAEQEVLPAR